EDGIRDFHVTGVQTCALPISEATGRLTRAFELDSGADGLGLGGGEAVAAVDRPVEPRHEGNFSFLAAGSASDHRRLAISSRVGALASPVRPAVGAALRFIEQPLLEVEPLLTGCEHEARTAIAAYQSLVLEVHCAPLPRTRPQYMQAA